MNIINMVLTGYKVVKGFMTAWKFYLIAAAVLSAAATVFLYVSNHEKMKATIPVMEAQVASCEVTTNALRAHVVTQNERIAGYNVQRKQDFLEAMARAEAMKIQMNELRKANELLREELSGILFRNVEAIQDDEDFADWVDGDVPSTAWSLLREAAEGSGDS
jgi:hypothetical protein